MSEVKTCELGDLIEFQRGYDLPKSEFRDGPYPVQSSNGILGYHIDYKVEGPGITIGRSGTVGIPHYLNENFYPHNTTLFVKDFKGNDRKYIYYLLKHLKLNDFKTGSGVPTMNRNHLHPLKVNAFIDKNYQVKLSSILSILDQKIALNNQINEELEAMAKTLYDYWFVQFDFPDENGKPYKSSGGKMVYNDQLKREIPEGWGGKQLGEICNPTSGYPFASNTYVQDGKFKIYTIKNVQDNGILPITDNTLDTLPANLPEKCILGPGDMLMSLTGNVGRVGIVFEDNALLNQRVLKIESKYKAFIFQFLKDPRTRSLLENTATGTSQKNLSPKDVMDISIIFPGFNVLIEFEQISNEILLQIISNNQQNQELTQLRDWLLPMLMNGQVRVE